MKKENNNIENWGHSDFLTEYQRVLEICDPILKPHLRKVLHEASRRLMAGTSDFKKQRKKKEGQLNKSPTKKEIENKWLNK